MRRLVRALFIVTTALAERVCLLLLSTLLSSGSLAGYYWPQEAYDVIHDTVEILRQQRHGMIQTESQYLFLYQAIKKLWHDQYGAMAEEGSGASAAQRGEVES